MRPVRTSKKARLNIAESKMGLAEKTRYYIDKKLKPKKDIIKTYFAEVTPTRRTTLLRRMARIPLRMKTERRTACQSGKNEDQNENQGRMSQQGKKFSPAKLHLFSTVEFSQAACYSRSSLPILLLPPFSTSVSSLTSIRLILHSHFLSVLLCLSAPTFSCFL